MTIFFTSDTHFGHRNIIKYCNRPFQTIEEHDQKLIENWNSVVQKGDIIYHLGDFGFGDIQYIKKICSKLKGQINLILGNHDTNINKFSDRFGFIKDTHLLKTKLNSRTVQIFMSHYPHRTWIHRPRNCYHLYGHVHGNLESHGLSFDVGVDLWKYTPISLEQVDSYCRTVLMPSWEIEKNMWNFKNTVKLEKV